MPSRITLPSEPWARPARDVLDSLGTDVALGLTSAEAERRAGVHGRNELTVRKSRGSLAILVDQFRNLVILILAAAAGVSAFLRDWTDTVAIGVAILLNALIGFITEHRAVRSMEALRRLSTVATRARRDGRLRELPAEELVPGDIVFLEGGDLVPADLRLVTANTMQADESTLTGESMPVDKGVEPVAADVSLAERTSMLFKGSSVTRGSGEGVVTATGMATELGEISASIEEAETERATPLEEKLDGLARRLIWISLVVAAGVGAVGLLIGEDRRLMLNTSIALAVAAIPEGLPIVATVALARGMWRMARQNALINRLSAVEVLGAVSVICTDKTGTLTENRMTVSLLSTSAGRIEIAAHTPASSWTDLVDADPATLALKVATLCNNASLHPQGPALGDPLEVALLEAASRAGLDKDGLFAAHPEVREEAFSSETKMMATVNRDGDGFFFAVKGAPEEVIRASSAILMGGRSERLDEEDKLSWHGENEALAGRGLRVLGLAFKRETDAGAPAYRELVLIGLVGLHDPPRSDVREALERSREAGIRVIMVTGDQSVTAKRIGQDLGIVGNDDVQALEGRVLEKAHGASSLPPNEEERLAAASIFARVSPRQKLNLIALHQRRGAVVAMTGDGVNDAPALKKADIGIAMGGRGTQVAVEASDMVLKDDSFSTIVAAVEQGRVIFTNIRRFIVFLLSGNVSQIAIVALGLTMAVPLPLLPLQILFLNVAIDVFPALALGLTEGSGEEMRRGPRPADEPILSRRHWGAVFAYGGLIAATVLAALYVAVHSFGMAEAQAVTVSFLTLAFGRQWHVFNMRLAGGGLLRNELTINPYVWLAFGVCSGLLLSAVYIPFLASILGLIRPDARTWAFILSMSLVPLAAGQLAKTIRSRRG